jgi:hypothetical protein
MADLSSPLAAPASTFGGLLNTVSSNGLTDILQVIQDGFGRNSPLSLSTNAININTQMGGVGSGFFIDDVRLDYNAAEINLICDGDFSWLTGALSLPKGTTAQRPAPAVNGDIRYNTTIGGGEIYVEGVWVTINAGNPGAYYPGGPTYIADSYAAVTYNLSVGSPQHNLTGRTNCAAFGDYSLQALSTGSNATAIGFQSLMLLSTGNWNTAVGSMCLNTLTTGYGNTATGKSSQQNNIGGNNNSTYGFESGLGLTGDDNSIYGSGAFRNTGSGDKNSVFGSQSSFNSIGVSNCSSFGYGALRENLINTLSAFGSLAGYSNISGSVDCFGFSSLYSNVYGDNNSAFSGFSLFNNIDGDNNCAFGYESIFENTAGDNISAFGYRSAKNITTSGSSAFGALSLFSNTTGTNNCAFGYESIYSNTTGTNISAFGYQALKNTIAIETCAFGAFSLFSNTSGIHNNAFGHRALFSNTTGANNNAFGQYALESNVTGIYNNAFGYTSLQNSLGNSNTAFGDICGQSLNNGSENSFFGYGAGTDAVIVTLNRCTFLGAATSATVDGLINATAVGHNVDVSQSNTVILGNSADVGIGTSTPENKLHVVGSVKFKGITAGYTGTGLVRSQHGVTTTAAGTATIDFPVSITAANQMVSQVTISAMSTDGLKVAYATSTAAAFWNGATTASSGTLPSPITFTGTAAFAVAAAWSISGNNLRLTVTGVASNDAVWVVSSEVYSSRNTAA